MSATVPEGGSVGPDEAHLGIVARRELDRARERRGSSAAYFTLPDSLD